MLLSPPLLPCPMSKNKNGASLSLVPFAFEVWIFANVASSERLNKRTDREKGREGRLFVDFATSLKPVGHP